MVQRILKKCLFVPLLLFGVGQVQGQDPVKLEFKATGETTSEATVPLSAFVTDGGLSIDGNVIHCDGNSGKLTLYLDSEDFSHVTQIKANVTTDGEYIDLFHGGAGGKGCSIGNVNTFTYSCYDVDFDANVNNNEELAHFKWCELDASKSVSSIVFMTGDQPTAGSMLFESLVVYKNVPLEVPELEVGEICLNELPYLRSASEPTTDFANKIFEEGECTWNMGVPIDGNSTFYGDRWNVQNQQQYVDLNQYDELRLYMSNDGVQIRCWFIDDSFNYTVGTDGSITFAGENIITVTKPSNDAGKDYATISLDEVKSQCGGNAYLIGILISGSGTTTLYNATVYDKDATANVITATDGGENSSFDYIISGEGEMTEEAIDALADANATVIDATGLTAPAELESANPNCLFIVNDASQLTNTKNVVVKGADGTYTCSNLVLTAGKPFRAPFDIQVENAYADFNIGDSGWTTLMLPFDADLDDDVFYAYNVAMNEDEVEYTETGLVEANQPILVYAEKGAYELSAKGVTIAATESASLTNGALTGVYTATACPEDGYMLQTANGKTTFSKPEKATNVAPFAAYLTGAAEAVEMPEIIFPVELTFDETGKAYVYPEDMQVTGMTLDTETGLLTKDYTGNAKIFVNLGNTDLSEVVAIKVNVDVDGEGYTDLFWRTSIRSKTEEINNWTGDGKYDIDYTDFQASSEHVASIELQTDYNIMGQMKITSICFMKTEDSEIVDLKDIPYMVKEGDAWNQGDPDWALNCDTSTVYGRGSTVPMFYADLSEYDELRIYQTAGDPVRVFFFNDKSDEFVAGATPESDYYFMVNTTTDPALTVGEEYSTVDLKAIKEKFGVAKLIAIKASAFDTKANVSQLAVVKYPEVIDPDAPFELTFDEEGKAYIYPNIMTASGELSIDPQTGIVTKNYTGNGSLHIDLGDVDLTEVTRIEVNVDVADENGYNDLMWRTIVRNQTEDIYAWTGNSKYDINYTQSDFQERSEHIAGIELQADYNRLGDMKINYICLIKGEPAPEVVETDLLTIPYLVLDQATGEWNEGTPTWNVDNGEQNTIYGNGTTVPLYYADLDGYEELRIYQTTGDPVRVFFFNENSDEYEAGMDQNGYFQTVYAVADPLNDYLTVDLKAIKEQYGFVKLIAIKASAYDTNATVTKITVTKTEGGSEEPEEPEYEASDLHTVPYMVKGADGTWAEGTPDWNVGLSDQGTIYGSGDSNPIRYADLSEYDELRIYQTAGDPVRLFFFNDKSDEYVEGETTGYYETVYAVAVEGEDYLIVDLNTIKEEFGFVKLIGIKASSWNTTATVSQLTLIKYAGGSEEPEEPQGPVELTFDEEGKAYIYPADMQVEGMTIDRETGVLTKAEAGNANILIDLGDVDLSDVTRIDVNVDVTSEGYTDLFWRTIIRNQTEDINAWYTSKYGIDYTAGDYQSRSENIKDILMETAYETVGTMKINYICITKDMSGETGIDSVSEAAEATVVGIYDMSGRRMDSLTKGINIVKLSDGTTKKVLVK